VDLKKIFFALSEKLSAQENSQLTWVIQNTIPIDTAMLTNNAIAKWMQQGGNGC
jgi:hypothetical protein